MVTTYRAAFYETPDKQGQIVLTGMEQSGMSDADLIEAAVAEAYRGDIVRKDGDGDRISEAALRDGLRIGDWRE